MSSTNAPFGLRPVRHISGSSPRIESLVDGIASGYNATILAFRPIKYDTAGVLQAADAGDEFIGTFRGCEYTTSDGTRVISPMWTASAAYVAGTMIAYFTEDPDIIYEIQATGAIAQTAIGGQADFSNATAGSTATGFSQATLSTTIQGSGGTANLRIMGLADGPDNAWGDSFTVVEVMVAEHQFAANKNAI